MNIRYRSIWNHALNAWVAVSELARGQGKRSSGAVLAGAVAAVVLGGSATQAMAQAYSYAPGENFTLGRTISGTTPLTVNVGAAEQSGVVSGNTPNSTLVKNGVGTLTLSGNNTWLGNVEIVGGTLRVFNDGNLGNAGNQIVLSNAGTLQLAQSVFNSARALQSATGGTLDVAGTEANVFSGPIAMSGTLRLINSAAAVSGEPTRLTFTSSNNTGFTGGTQIGTAGGVGSPGRLNVDVTGAGTLGSGPVDINFNAALGFQGAGASAAGLNITVNESSNSLGTNSGVAFANGATAGNANITLNAVGSYVSANDAGSSFGSATIINNGGRVYVQQTSTGGSSTILNTNGLVSLDQQADMSGAKIANNGVGDVRVAFSDTGVAIGELSGGGTFTLGSKTLTVGALNTDSTISGVISDTGKAWVDKNSQIVSFQVNDTGGSLVKVGTGTLTLTGANTYSGGTAINGGALQVGADNNLGAVAGGLALNGGTLRYGASFASARTVALGAGNGTFDTNGNTATLSGVASGTGGLVKIGAGTLVLAGANTYGGGTTVNAGTVQIANDANLGAAAGGLTLNGGTVQLAAGGNSWTSARNISVLGGGGTLDLNQQKATLSGVMSGAGALNVTSSTVTGTNNGGVLSLNTAATRTGTTTLSNGVNVNTSVTGALGSGNVILVNGSNRLNFSGSASAGAQTYVVGGTGAGDVNNGIAFNGSATAGTATFNLNGANTIGFNGTSSAQGATINNTGGAVNFAAGSTAGAATMVNSGGGSLTFSDKSQGGTASITNQGASTLTVLGGAQLATASVVNLDSSKVDLSGAAGAVSIGSLSGAGAVVLGAQALTVGGLNANNAISGVVGGTGASLVKDGTGTLTLTGANTYTGGTTLVKGRIDVGTDSALGTGQLAMNEGTTLGFVADNLNIANPILLTGITDPIVDTGAFTETLSGAITGGGILTKNGSGTLIVSGANSYTGATSIAQGTMRAGAANTFSSASAHTVATGATLDTAGFNQTVASLNNSGTVSLVGVAPGSTLTVNGGYVGNGGVLRLGTFLGASSSASDRLVLNGGTATGNTSIQITQQGGLGAQTTGDGINLVTAQNGATTAANAFTLAGGHVDAGAFEYRLFDGDASGAGENWYLRSTTNVVTPPVDPGTPATPVTPGTPTPPATRLTYRAEVPLYSALPAILRQGDLAMLSTLHRRVGDESTFGNGSSAAVANTNRAWGRILGGNTTVTQNGTTSPESRTSFGGFQTGVDLFANPEWNA
ncbi:MAG: hypothetical protein EOO24_10705, partial [Comamonadaceae bacterium]